MSSKHNKNIIFIETKKYSTFFQSVFKKYNNGVDIEIDGCQYSENDINSLIKDWCKNKVICNTRNFSLSRNDEVLFSFHDHPDELLGALSEKEFLEKLALNKIIKIKYGKEG